MYHLLFFCALFITFWLNRKVMYYWAVAHTVAHCGISDVIINMQHTGGWGFSNECDRSQHFTSARSITSALSNSLCCLCAAVEFLKVHGTSFKFLNLYKPTGCSWGLSQIILGKCVLKAAKLAGWSFCLSWSSVSSLYRAAALSSSLFHKHSFFKLCKLLSKAGWPL